MKHISRIAHSLLLLTAFAAIGANLSAQTEPSGAIRGRVVDSEGRPVFGAMVQTSRQPGFGTETELTVARAESSGDGSFDLTGLNPGIYRLCVQQMGSALLDPCEWSDAPVTVQLNAGGLMQGIDVPVEFGTLLRIAIDDPQETLKAEEADTKRKTSFLYVAIRSRAGNLRKAMLLRTTTTGYELGTAVPNGQDAHLFIAGSNVRLNDKDNRSLPESGEVITVPKQVIPGTSTDPLRFGLSRREAVP
jgi:hypothetical protein